MTSRDFQVFAKLLGEMLNEIGDDKIVRDRHIRLIQSVADYFGITNLKFNRARFIEACGL